MSVRLLHKPVIFALLFAFLCCGDLASAATRPNVVVLLVDDLGYADVSCLANGAVKTPNLDRLAAMGVKFTSGYVTARCVDRRGRAF